MLLQTHREIKPKITLLTNKQCDVCSNSAHISSQPIVEIPHDDGTGEDDVEGKERQEGKAQGGRGRVDSLVSSDSHSVPDQLQAFVESCWLMLILYSDKFSLTLAHSLFTTFESG